MKLNVIFVFGTINSIKLQKVHFYIMDLNFSGNQGVKIGELFKKVKIFSALFRQENVPEVLNMFMFIELITACDWG